MKKLVLCFCLLAASFAFAAGSSTTEVESTDLEKVQALVEAQNYSEAVSLLKILLNREESADYHNYMAYSLRNLEQYDESMEHYMLALELEPEHLGANEYLGELYLRLGELDKAQGQLDALASFGCEAGCLEFDTLAEVINTFTTTGEVSW